MHANVRMQGTTLCLVGRGYHPDQPSNEQECLAGEVLAHYT